MTHRRARSWMALAAGGDLCPGRKQRLEEHLAACADCRKEFRTYEEALGLTASLAAKDQMPDWTEAEWRRVIGLTVSQAPAKQGASRRPIRDGPGLRRPHFLLSRSWEPSRSSGVRQGPA